MEIVLFLLTPWQKNLTEPIQRRKNLFNLCDEKLQSELQEIYNNN